MCLPDLNQSDFGFCSKVDVPENESTGHCHADSDPHIHQFDGNTFDVMGTCLYTLVQFRDPPIETGPGPEISHLAVRGSLVKSKDESFKVNIKNYRAWPTSQESLLIKACNVRESNPGLPRGRREFYH